jgi:hypothetical protein
LWDGGKMTTREENAHLLRKGVEQAVEGIRGELGRKEAGGSYTVPTGQVNEVYVRLYGDPNNLVTAIDLITSRKSRLPVRVRLNTSGRYEVIGVDPLPANVFLGEAAPSQNLPPMNGGAVNAVWESHQFKPGRIRSLNGADLQVYMEEVQFSDDTLLGDVDGDMTATVATIASGKKAWIITSVNPVTNELAFTKGADFGLAIPLSKAAGAVVTVPAGHIKLWGHILRAGATYLPVMPQSPDTLYFADFRPWFAQPKPYYTAAITTTDNTATTLDSIDIDEDTLTTITGVFSGVRDDYSAAITGTFVAGVRRAASGDATLVGATVTSNEDSSGSPTFTVDADTGTQTARLRIEGITAEDWNWTTRYEVLRG